MRVSPEVEIAFALAQREAARRRQEYVTVEHLLYALLFDDATALVVKHSGGDVARLKKELERFLDEQLEQLSEADAISTSKRVTPCSASIPTAGQSRSAKTATRTFAPFSSFFPELCTCIAAR